MDTTPLQWTLDADTSIRPFVPEDGPAVHTLIQKSREHLDRWIRWSHTLQTQADVDTMIARYVAKSAEGDGFHSGIWIDGQLAGGVVCRSVDQPNRNAEIGYWLGQDFTGRGLATRAAAMMTGYLFRARSLHRIEMRCGVLNIASRAIPERLGYRLEGTLRETHWITDRFFDHAVYGLLAREWAAQSPPHLSGGVSHTG